jgi:hypothetical protein
MNETFTPSETENSVPHRAFKLNCAPATAEVMHLKVYTLKVNVVALVLGI